MSAILELSDVSVIREGNRILSGVTVERLQESEAGVDIHYSPSAGKKQVADAVLLATGRAPETQLLNLEAAGIETDEKGFVQVEERLQTSAENVWAIGDVNGGPQFTYISLDDFRIIKNPAHVPLR